MRAAPIALAIITALTGCAEPRASTAGTSPDAMDQPAPGVRDEIVAALQSVFDALADGDADLLRGVMDPDIVMTYSETSPDGETDFGSSTLAELATRIETSDASLIERMWDPVVRVSGAMATIWTPYDFYVGSEFSHCGVDAATLMNTEDGWKVVGLSWTRLQPPACPLHPDGPPSQ
jgi:hypothetical protein